MDRILHDDDVAGRLNRLATTSTSAVALVGKGGGGKTTAATNLAAIANHQGWRVGIADADPQRSTYKWRSLRATNDIPVRPCRPDQLNEVLALAKKWEIQRLFIDVSSDATQALSAVQLADFALVLMQPSLLDIDATRAHVEQLQAVGRPYGVVIHRAPSRRQGVDMRSVREAREAVLAFTNRLWRGQITDRQAIRDATVTGHGVAEIDWEGPAAREYRALWSAVTREIRFRRR